MLFSRTRHCTSKLFSAAAVVAALTIASSTGCGSEGSTEPVSVTPAIEKVKTETVAASTIRSERSPATQPMQLPDTDATPEEVCQTFMDHLNAGERVKAEKLLTSAALSTTARAGLYLQPIGSKNAKVEIKQAGFATDKMNLAQVACVVTDIENGKPVTDELTWVIRRSKSGWRILGFMLKIDDQTQDFLSFENARDVDAILQMSGDSNLPQDKAPSRQASRTTNPQTRLN